MTSIRQRLSGLTARWLALATILLGGCCPQDAWAWGKQGHEVVALVADGLLTPKARGRVAEILASEPGATLVSISNWADETRSPATASWHYVNLPRDADCVYSPPRDCPNGNCVIEVIRAQVLRLSAAKSRASQLEALKYLVHLVADLHQPLHAAFADDRGGNTYQLQAFGRGTNLHAVWDTALLARIVAATDSLASVIQSYPSPGTSTALVPEEWAAESCRIASGAGFYPGRDLDATYAERFRPIAAKRLHLAAMRLAATLNSIFTD